MLLEREQERERGIKHGGGSIMLNHGHWKGWSLGYKFSIDLKDLKGAINAIFVHSSIKFQTCCVNEIVNLKPVYFILIPDCYGYKCCGKVTGSECLFKALHSSRVLLFHAEGNPILHLTAHVRIFLLGKNDNNSL